MFSTLASHATKPGSIPGLGMCRCGYGCVAHLSSTMSSSRDVKWVQSAYVCIYNHVQPLKILDDQAKVLVSQNRQITGIHVPSANRN